jgi:hypothetical protein
LTWSVGPTPDDDRPDRPNFSFEVTAGDVVEDSIRVRNFGDQPLALDIYASDAVITSTGALDLLPAGEDPSDVGVWIELPTEQIVVPSGTAVDVAFTMIVPGDAEPGDHTGGIVTSVRSEVTTEDGRAVVLDRRLGNRVLVRVDGELRPELTVTDLDVVYDGPLLPFRTGTLRVEYTVTNTGNLRLDADQHLEAPGRIGFPGRSQDAEPIPELLPGSSLRLEHEMPAVWPTFRTMARVVLEPVPASGDAAPEMQPVGASGSTWSIPWGLLLLLLVVAGGVGWVAWSRRRRTRREEAIRAEARAKALQSTEETDADGAAATEQVEATAEIEATEQAEETAQAQETAGTEETEDIDAAGDDVRAAPDRPSDEVVVAEPANET